DDEAEPERAAPDAALRRDQKGEHGLAVTGHSDAGGEGRRYGWGGSWLGFLGEGRKEQRDLVLAVAQLERVHRQRRDPPHGAKVGQDVLFLRPGGRVAIRRWDRRTVDAGQR